MISSPRPSLRLDRFCPTCGTPWHGADPGVRSAAPSELLGLRVPADPARPVSLVTVEPSAVAISEQIGGGLLDDTTRGVAGGGRYTMYLDDERVPKALPVNARAIALVTRLGYGDGYGDPQCRSEVRGDALVLGCAPLDDTDVPPAVLRAAFDAGLLER